MTSACLSHATIIQAKIGLVLQGHLTFIYLLIKGTPGIEVQLSRYCLKTNYIASILMWLYQVVHADRCTTLVVSFVVILAVSRYAREQIQPLVREMDEKSEMGHPLIKSLFENGVRQLKYKQGVLCVSMTFNICSSWASRLTLTMGGQGPLSFPP